MRFKYSDLLLFILIFVFVAAFPVDLLPIDYAYKLLVLIGLRLMLLSYYIYIIIKWRIKIFGVENIKNLLFCIPFVLIGFSNIIATKIDGTFGPIVTEPLVMVFLSILTLLTAITEEIIFRLFIQNALYRTSSVKRIFASAGIFALMHLLRMVNVSSIDALISVLLQTVYTFGLGLLLGVLYEYSHSLVGAIILHFCFNFFNDTLFTYLNCNPSTLSYYLSAVGTAIIVGIYALLITIFIFRKYNRYYRS